jgi:hypothetical protein
VGKQYAYYRKPDGKPHHGDETEYAPNAILAEMGKTAFLGADGKVSWLGLQVPLRFQVALRSAFAIFGPDDVEVNEEDAWDIVWKTLLASVKSAPGKSVAAKALLHAVNDAAAAFFRMPLVAYALVSSLSIASFPARRIKVGECTISALKKRGARFPLPQVLSTPNL